MSLFLLITTQSSTWIWLMVAIFLGVIEAIAVNVIAIWFMLGAILTLPLTFFDVPFVIELAWFFVSSIVLLIFTRPVVKRYFKIGTEKTNLDTIIDAQGVVLISNHPQQVGELKIEGKIWRFQSLSGKTYEVDELATIREIKGVTLWVD